MKKNQQKEIKVPDYTEIEKYTHFSFSYEVNAINVAMSLAQAGYFINIVRDGTGYRVDIYQRAKR